MSKRIKKVKVEFASNENKADKFTRIATRRVGKSLKAIRTIGYCTGSGYEWSDEQAEQIITVSQSSITELANKFDSKQEKQSEFAFTE